jgi:hypothetical protein
MKRFDFAGEVAKQLITICSAIITVVIAFYEKFFTHGDWSFYLVLADLVVFILSIGAGVLSLGGIVTLVERQERQDASRSKLRPIYAFVRIGGSTARLCAMWQQGLFLFGLLCFVLIAVVDRSTAKLEVPAQSTIQGKQTARYKETDHVKTFYRVNRYPPN